MKEEKERCCFATPRSRCSRSEAAVPESPPPHFFLFRKKKVFGQSKEKTGVSRGDTRSRSGQPKLAVPASPPPQIKEKLFRYHPLMAPVLCLIFFSMIYMGLMGEWVMDKIIKLNRRHIAQLALIDFESEHQEDRKRNISKSRMKKGIQKRFDEGNELFFGYKKNNELVGYVAFKKFFPGHKHGEVYWLAVKKKHQGKKIGTKLMKFIEKWAKKNGFRKVCLYTGKNMAVVRKFYEKLGYEMVNEFPGYYGYTSGNTTAVLYAKLI